MKDLLDITSLILLKNIYYASLKTPLNLIKFIHALLFLFKVSFIYIYKKSFSATKKNFNAFHSMTADLIA